MNGVLLCDAPLPKHHEDDATEGVNLVTEAKSVVASVKKV